MYCAKPAPVAAVGTAFEHRMADIAAWQSDALKIRRLERQ